MRTLAKNKQKMYYALKENEERNVYVLDRNGNRNYLFTDEDGIDWYETERVVVFPEVVPFKGNIAESGGEAEAVEFGVNVGDYEAVLLMSKGSLPIDETSRIWHETEPQIEEKEYWFEFEPEPRKISFADYSTADYSVLKKSPSLNQSKYILKKVVK